MNKLELAWSPRRGGSSIRHFGADTTPDDVERAIMTRFRAREEAALYAWFGTEEATIIGGVEKVDRWTWWYDKEAVAQELAALRAVAACDAAPERSGPLAPEPQRLDPCRGRENVMTAKEKKEQSRLSKKWACRTATMKEMDRCRELDHKDRAEREAAHQLLRGKAPEVKLDSRA